MLIEGAGEGHGVGMSQDGAYGYARHGWSYQQILAHYYTGTTLGAAPAKATVKVLVGSRVVKLSLERYVRRVIAREMPAGWPAAALQAQAVASRTYALTAHAGGSRFDVYSDTRSQVYGGAAAETPPTNSATAATAGTDRAVRGPPRHHLLLRELRRHDRGHPELVPRLGAGAVAARRARPIRQGAFLELARVDELQLGSRAAARGW